jgi:hypothetical protein
MYCGFTSCSLFLLMISAAADISSSGDSFDMGLMNTSDDKIMGMEVKQQQQGGAGGVAFGVHSECAWPG